MRRVVAILWLRILFRRVAAVNDFTHLGALIMTVEAVDDLFDDNSVLQLLAILRWTCLNACTCDFNC